MKGSNSDVYSFTLLHLSVDNITFLLQKWSCAVSMISKVSFHTYIAEDTDTDSGGERSLRTHSVPNTCL